MTVKRRRKKTADGSVNPFEIKDEPQIVKKDETVCGNKRRSFDTLKITRAECYACDAATQTIRKQKDFCKIC